MLALREALIVGVPARTEDDRRIKAETAALMDIMAFEKSRACSFVNL